MKPSRQSTGRRLLMLELNEFSEDVLFETARRFNLQNILRLQSLQRRTTWCDRTVEHEGLDPWVQWVSVHSGQPSEVHGIKYLDESQFLEHRQIWEGLSDKGLTSIVWGVLNSKKGVAPNCRIFVPDIWNSHETAEPQGYKDLVRFPHYVSTHRTEFSWRTSASLFVPFLLKALFPTNSIELLKISPLLIKAFIRFFGKEFVGFTIFEHFSSRIFFKKWREQKPTLGILFLNGLAHVQHYYWSQPDRQEVRFTLLLLERMLKLFWEEVDRERCAVIVLNGLTQVSTAPWHLYRPRNHEEFLGRIGVKFKNVNALMSYDANIIFDSRSDLELAVRLLRSATIRNASLFTVDDHQARNLTINFRVRFSNPVVAQEKFQIDDKSWSFDSHFVELTRRDSEHSPQGTLYTSLEGFPDGLKTHQLSTVIQAYLDDVGLKAP